MIWLVGGGGLLGREVSDLLTRRACPYFSTGSEVNITSQREVLAVAKKRQPAWIVNCAAYTAVDQAELEESTAFAVNALGPLHLCQAAQAGGARLIHISTDYVFDGQGIGPYDEGAQTTPLGAYGRTKASGEALVRENCAMHYIVRTSWLHGPRGRSFVATVLRLLGERSELRIVSDQAGRPTYAYDLAETLYRILVAPDPSYGTYHYANQGQCTWHSFAEEIQAQALAAGQIEARKPIVPIASTAYPTLAKRPPNSVLALQRIEAFLGIEIPQWQDGLSRHLMRLWRRGG